MYSAFLATHHIFWIRLRCFSGRHQHLPFICVHWVSMKTLPPYSGATSCWSFLHVVYGSSSLLPSLFLLYWIRGFHRDFIIVLIPSSSFLLTGEQIGTTWSCLFHGDFNNPEWRTASVQVISVGCSCPGCLQELGHLCRWYPSCWNTYEYNVSHLVVGLTMSAVEQLDLKCYIQPPVATRDEVMAYANSFMSEHLSSWETLKTHPLDDPPAIEKDIFCHPTAFFPL